MKCPICDGEMYDVEKEYICSDCGAAFGLEYLGMYEEGSCKRIDEGFEPIKWKILHSYNLKKFREE